MSFCSDECAKVYPLFYASNYSLNFTAWESFKPHLHVVQASERPSPCCSDECVDDIWTARTAQTVLSVLVARTLTHCPYISMR